MNLKKTLLLGILVGSPSLVQAYSWKNPNPLVDFSYIYVPGIASNETFMASFCPCFTASSGERVTCSKGIEVVGLPATCPNMPEIRHGRPPMPPTDEKMFNSMIRYFAQGFEYISTALVSKSMGFHLERPKHLDKNEKYESLSQHWIDETKADFGQQGDIHALRTHIKNHVAQEKKDKGHTKLGVILYGTSRGAATVFNYTALDHPHHVCAIICESLLDSLEHVAEATTSTRIRKTVELIPKHTKFDHNGILPIKLVKKMPLDMPILLITSHADITVPEECTLNMYNALRTAGYNNVHILILDKADHGFYPYAKTAESGLYQSVVHAFYKHYNLPYIEEYADRGHAWFATQTQPFFKDPIHMPK